MAMAESIVPEEEKTEIPEDVNVLEILTYLPAKNLQKLQTVSKDWLELISSPYFVRLHRSRACVSRIRVLLKLSSGMIEYNNYDNQEMKQIPCPPQLREFSGLHIRFMGSSDGLICMSYKNGGHGVLFNPSTGKCLQLWPYHSPEFYDILCYWFGCVDGEYVLIMGLIHPTRPRSEFRVYKPTSSGIKCIHLIFFDIHVPGQTFFTIIERGTFVNGVVHWCVRQVTNEQDSFTILAYHIYENKVWRISPPAQCDFRLGVDVNGCLLVILKNMDTSVFEVWIMKELWIKFANIDGFNIKDTKVLSPLGFSSGGELILDADKSRLMNYSFNHNVATVLVEYPNDGRVFEAIMCADTLVSPSISD